MTVTKKYWWIILLVLVVFCWIGILVWISIDKDLISLPFELPTKSAAIEGQVYKRLYTVESWDSEYANLNLIKNGVKSVYSIDPPEVKVFLKNGIKDEMVLGRDTRWKILFCPGDKVMVLTTMKNNKMTVVEVDNLKGGVCK